MKRYLLISCAVMVPVLIQSMQRTAARLARSASSFSRQAAQAPRIAQASRALSTMPAKIEQKHQESSPYKTWGIGTGILAGLGIYGYMSTEKKEKFSQAQKMEPASIWATLDEKGALSKHVMVNSFVQDCEKYESQNNLIPPHIKNEQSMRVMTYNVFGWKNVYNEENFNGIVSIIKKINPDILVLQEVLLDDEKHIKDEFAKMGYGYHVFCNTFFTGIQFGTMLFSKYPLEKVKAQIFQADKMVKSYEKRGYIKATVLLPHDKKCTIYATHLDVWDNSGALREAEMREIIKQIGNNPDNSMIVGDFNCVRTHDYDYAINGRRAWDILVQSTIARTGFPPSTIALDLLAKHSFIDSFARHNVVAPRFTVWNGTAVDFLFLNKNWSLKSLGSYIYYTAASDHLPVIADFAI